MFSSLLLCAALAVGQTGNPAPTAPPEPSPGSGTTLALPASLFPSPADQPPPAPAGPTEPPRRAMPSPFDSPPLPGSEYQGYPLIGVPPDFTIWPLMQALQGTSLDDALISNRIRFYGWVTVEGNLSTSKNSQHAGLLLDSPQQRRYGPGRLPPRAQRWTRCRPTTSTGASAPPCSTASTTAT